MSYARASTYFVSDICDISSSSMTMVSMRCSDSRQQLQYAPSHSQTYRCVHTEHLHPILINGLNDIEKRTRNSCSLSHFFAA